MLTREDELSHIIIGAAMEVHSALGPGLLEGAYEACLRVELETRGLEVQSQLPIPVVYKGQPVGCGFRLDLLVEDLVLIEVKAVERLAPIHKAQAITYLRLTGKKLCLILNFNVLHMRDGVERVVMGL